jgi:sec-independent protein translocase protein TatA
MNLGLPEMLMIFGVALLFFGPKKLPELGRSLGRGIVEFRNASREIRDNFVHQISVAGEPDEGAGEAPLPNPQSTRQAGG